MLCLTVASRVSDGGEADLSAQTAAVRLELTAGELTAGGINIFIVDQIASSRLIWFDVFNIDIISQIASGRLIRSDAANIVIAGQITSSRLS